MKPKTIIISAVAVLLVLAGWQSARAYRQPLGPGLELPTKTFAGSRCVP